jgi:diacylglycerol kinase family enzyme
MKINLYKVIIDLCFKKFVRILKIEVWINNLLNSLLKTNPDTLIIINPKASGGKYENDIEGFCNALIHQQLGENITIKITKKAGEATRFTRKYIKKNYQKIIAIGGDGTLNEVATGFFEPTPKYITTSEKLHDLILISSKVVFGIIPGGTRNILAKSLKIPTDPLEVCNNIKMFKPKKIDLISIVSQNSKKRLQIRVCLNSAEIGIGAEIIDRAKMIREKINSRTISTALGIISTLPSYQSNECEIVLDEGRKKINTNMTMAIVANGSYIAGEFQPAYKAKNSDGFLDIVIVNDSGSLKFLTSLIDIKMEDHSDKANIIYEQAKNVILSSLERSYSN